MPSKNIKYLFSMTSLFDSTACIMSCMALVPPLITWTPLVPHDHEVQTGKILPFEDHLTTLYEVRCWEFCRILRFPWSCGIVSACSWIQIKWEKLREQEWTQTFLSQCTWWQHSWTLEIGLAISSDLHRVLSQKNTINKLYLDKVCSPCRSFPNCFCSNMLLSDFNWP